MKPENIVVTCTHCGMNVVTSKDGNRIIKCPACAHAFGKKEPNE